MELTVEIGGQDAQRELNDRLVRFNRLHADWRPETFCVVVRDEKRTLKGGAAGVVNMGLVYVHALWLDDELRGKGVGRRVMLALEEEARRRGASRAALDTYDFQARDFYEHLGYRVYGALAYPAGVEQYYLVKDL